jgi:alanine dehydrogenase
MAFSRSRSTIVLRRDDVAALLGLDECIGAVERALALEARGLTPPAALLGMQAEGGAFHIKAALLDEGGALFAAKINANFPDNPERCGLPAIQGVVVLADGRDGFPLAVMDSIEITIRRTGAATAIAARHLARTDASVATICGCGNQGRIQLQALARVRSLAMVHAFDRDMATARRFADDLGRELRLDVRPAASLAAAVRDSDICITCTPARTWLVAADDVRPGTFIAAVGADNHDKQELEPVLLARSRLVVDAIESCATIGELHHALDAGLLVRGEVHATLGEIAAGLRPGRISPDQTFVFDSTGTALEDAAAAALVYEAARKAGRGTVVQLA